MKFKPGARPSAVFEPGTPAIGVHSALRRHNSFALQLFGTSSGDETTEWFGLLGKRLAEEHGYNCLWQVWSDTTSTYSRPTHLVTASAGDRYLSINGSRFDFTAPAITGDIDVVAKLEPTSWATGSSQIFLSQARAGGNNYSWYFGISGTGALLFKWYPNGTTTGAVTVTNNATRTETGPLWVRVTHDVDNGAAGNDTKFYTSTDGSTWTQSGTTTTTANTTNHFNSTAPFQLGCMDTGINFPIIGKVYWVEIRNGIGNGSYSVVPPLPELWDAINATSSKPIVFGGAPVILLHNGSRAAQQITYFYDPARVAPITEQCAPVIAFTSFNHNDYATTSQDFIAKYKLMVAAIKAAYPDVPIIMQSQSPMKTPKDETDIWADGVRGASLARYATSTAGLYYIDLWRSVTDVATMINSDGIHPSARGSATIRDAYLNTFFGGSAGYEGA